MGKVDLLSKLIGKHVLVFESLGMPSLTGTLRLIKGRYRGNKSYYVNKVKLPLSEVRSTEYNPDTLIGTIFMDRAYSQRTGR